MNIYNGISELIGKTPLVRIKNYSNKYSEDMFLCVKLEGKNPAGSAKDRVAMQMIQEAEKSGLLKKGGTVIEPTSGNTGIGLAAICAAKGYRVILTMPDTMSVERRKLISAFGAEVVLTEGRLGMNGAIEKADALNKEICGSIVAGQFVNPENPKAHYLTTGPEIWEDTDGKVDVFVAGIGSGGTISGVGKYLKEKNPDIKIVGVEPADSPVITEGRSGSHKIQGIGAGFVPENLDLSVVDEVVAVDHEDAYEAARMLAKSEGILTGISSGAALFAATQIALREENKGKMVVVLLPDMGDRYLSTELYG